MKTLTNRQFSALGQVARRAFDALRGSGYDCGSFDEWRAETTADACGGRSSWKTLFQADYVPLYNAFAKIAGLPLHADHTPQSDAAALIWTIRDRLAHWEAPAPYYAKIIADKAGRPWIKPDMTIDAMLVGLDVTTLRQILYTLQARLRRKAARDAAALGIDAPAECHTSRSTVPPARLAAYRGDVINTNHNPIHKKALRTPRRRDTILSSGGAGERRP